MTEPGAADAAHVPVETLARAGQDPRPRGVIRAAPEDFVVEERLGFEPDGAGAHLWLDVVKRGLDTEVVARRLAAAAGVRPRDVGYSGLKDRHALTRQWFSVPAPAAEPDWSALEGESLRVERIARHGRKFRRGTHRANRFRIRVTGLGAADAGAVDAALERLSREGAPNYFGEQRFGRGAGNVARARALLVDGRRERRAHLRGILYSAARAMLFNRVLDARVRAGSWALLLAGELVALDGSRSVFYAPAVDAELEARTVRLDVHPSGPLPGRGGRRPSAAALEVESGALDGCHAWIDGLERAGLEHARRSLRVRVAALEGRLDGATLELAFELPAGAYATSVLRELVEYGRAPGAD